MLVQAVNKQYIVNQIALGLTDLQSNPYLWDIIREGSSRQIIMNYTTHGLDTTPEIAKRTAELCGAVAVSLNWPKSYDAIKMFTDAGMQQVNIHYMLSANRVKQAKKIVDDMCSDPRLKNVNAIVFLRYKAKGNNIGAFQPPTNDTFAEIVQYCENKGVPFGFDSCSAHAYLKCIEGRENYTELAQYVEPCESALFSAYINVHGEFFSCSFCENHGDYWQRGIQVLNYDNFIDSIWYSPKVHKWRLKLLGNSRRCPEYEV